MRLGYYEQPMTVLHTEIDGQPETEFIIANKIRNSWCWGQKMPSES